MFLTQTKNLMTQVWVMTHRLGTTALDHAILLKNLYIYGIRGTSFDLLKSYLSNRMQYFIYNGIRSSLNNIQCGVPQGSVLGLILFVLYINDL